jgi:general stress protein 26
MGSMTKIADAEALKKIANLIGGIEFAMLTSHDGGHLRSRPMVAAQSDFSGELFFVTRASAHKVDEVGTDSEVNVSYADGHKQTYVSLSGTASIERDPGLIAAHWRESVRTWFPKGQEDPDIAILKVVVDLAEYWDAQNSTMVHLFGYLKAVTTGRAPHPGENEKVRIA